MHSWGSCLAHFCRWFYLFVQGNTRLFSIFSCALKILLCTHLLQINFHIVRLLTFLALFFHGDVVLQCSVCNAISFVEISPHLLPWPFCALLNLMLLIFCPWFHLFIEGNHSSLLSIFLFVENSLIYIHLFQINFYIVRPLTFLALFFLVILYHSVVYASLYLLWGFLHIFFHDFSVHSWGSCLAHFLSVVLLVCITQYSSLLPIFLFVENSFMYIPSPYPP